MKLAVLAVLILRLPTSPQDEVVPVPADPILALGPLPDVPPSNADEPTAAAVADLAALDLRFAWPRAEDPVATLRGELRWRVLTPAEILALPTGRQGEGAVAWYGVAYLQTDRHGPVRVAAQSAGAMTLWVDGEEAARAGAVEDAETALVAEPVLATGTHRLALRVRSRADTQPMRLSTEALDGQVLSQRLDPRHAVADYDELREVRGVSGLSLSPDGRWLGRRVSRPSADRDGSEAWFEIVDLAEGGTRLIQSDASAVAWRADSGSLLLRRGNSLWTWDPANGAMHEVLHDEPGLGAVSWSKDGRLLVFASTRGAPAAPADGPQRRVELREKLDDWPTAPHLHLLVLESGLRRRLGVPGDWLQDAFQLESDGRHLITLRNLPRPGRPFFDSFVERIELESGEVVQVARLQMGFENRPGMSGMALSPDDRFMAFVGPPSELGDRATHEVNAFDPDLYVMDLSDGSWRKISRGLRASVDGHLHWSSPSTLCFQATDGSRSAVLAAEVAPDSYSVPLFSEAVRRTWPEVVQDLSFAADGRCVVVGSGTDSLPALYQGVAGGEAQLVESPNAELQQRWKLASPTDVPYELEDGTRIDAWLYRPEGEAPAKGWPLIVYYYGGASPTQRGYNELHQFLVARGYALLVMNPRGAAGYGQPFADHHAADWGEKAGADILRGLEITLAAHPELNAKAVGCYGGSYGGFMTMYLVSHSEAFAAAVSLYGISNLASYWGDGMWGWTYGDQAMGGRTPWTHPEWYVQQSPLYHADRIRTPLLLLHGGADGNVPDTESEQMFAALKVLDRPCELVSFPTEDHGLRGTWANRVAHRTMLVEWFDRYLKGQPQAWEARWK